MECDPDIGKLDLKMPFSEDAILESQRNQIQYGTTRAAEEPRTWFKESKGKGLDSIHFRITCLLGPSHNPSKIL